MASQGFSQKGQPALFLDGFKYNLKNKKNCGTQVWRCCKRGCAGRAETYSDGVSAQTKSHSCAGPTTINLMRLQPKCTTPKVPTRRGRVDQVNSCCQATYLVASLSNAATQEKVAALEQELSQMRAMVSIMLAAQGKSQGDSREVVPPTPFPGNPCVPTPPSVAPPSPPPPPPPPMNNNAPLQIKLRTGKGSNDGSSPNSTPLKAQTTNMLDVLKDLAYVKFRSIPKSPGGTPMKQPTSDNANDPAAMIAAALKKRFGIIHFPGPEASDSDDDRFVAKENLSSWLDDEAVSDCSPLKASGFKRPHLFESHNAAGGPKGKNPRK